jgi:hypothetical protein
VEVEIVLVIAEVVLMIDETLTTTNTSRISAETVTNNVVILKLAKIMVPDRLHCVQTYNAMGSSSNSNSNNDPCLTNNQQIE